MVGGTGRRPELRRDHAEARMQHRCLRVRPPIVLLLAATLLLALGGGSLAADAPDIDVTGHWASVDAGGIDLIQTGTSVRGSSASGLQISGTISGRRVSFTFWRGRSYAKADRENRGTGSMVISADGRRASVRWQSQKDPAENRGALEVARPGSPGADGPPPASEDADRPSASLDDDPLADESLAAEELAQVNGFEQQVTSRIDELRLPGLPGSSGASTANGAVGIGDVQADELEQQVTSRIDALGFPDLPDLPGLDAEEPGSTDVQPTMEEQKSIVVEPAPAGASAVVEPRPDSIEHQMTSAIDAVRFPGLSGTPDSGISGDSGAEADGGGFAEQVIQRIDAIRFPDLPDLDTSGPGT